MNILLGNTCNYLKWEKWTQNRPHKFKKKREGEEGSWVEEGRGKADTHYTYMQI